MAEDKKPKIDLKARLGKTAVGVAPPPGAVPAPVVPGSAGSASSATPPPPQAIPVPPGVGPSVPASPFGGPSAPPPALDPNSPLAAVALPQRPVAPAVPQLQRIEVDEASIEEARRGARKQAMFGALLFAAVFGAVGWVAGGAMERGNARSVSVADAQDLAKSVRAAKDQLADLEDKIKAGREKLGQRSFPKDLARTLGGINIDFDGTKLAGRRFSGFKSSTTQGLVEFSSRVQAANDKKSFLQRQLSSLEKPLTEQWSVPAGTTMYHHVVVLGKGPTAFLAPLKEALPFKGDGALPSEFTFLDPKKSPKTIPRYSGGDIAKQDSAIQLTPQSFEAACPSESGVAAAQLAAGLASLAREIRGESAGKDSEAVSDGKPGLIEVADRLAKELEAVN